MASPLAHLRRSARVSAPFAAGPRANQSSMWGALSAALNVSPVTTIATSTKGKPRGITFDTSWGSSGGDWQSVAIAWRCLNLVAEGIATLAFKTFKTGDLGMADELIVPGPPVIDNPFPNWGRTQFYSFIVRSLILKGNSYAIAADFDPANGYPRQLVPIEPSRVEVELSEGGQVMYRIDGRGGWHLPWPLGPVWHIVGFPSDDGPTGIGVIEAGARTWGLADAASRYAQSNVGGAGVPSGVITVDRPELSEEQATTIKEGWMAAHGGPVKSPAVLPSSMSFAALGLKPTDVELSMLRQMTDADVCALFGVPASYLGVSQGSSMTYSNTEMSQAQLVQDTFSPWTTRLEEAMSLLLPRRTLTKIDYEPRLRPDLEARYRTYEVALRNRILTRNEIRGKEHEPPFPDGDFGEDPWQQSWQNGDLPMTPGSPTKPTTQTDNPTANALAAGQEKGPST